MDQAGVPKISAFVATIGRNEAFSHIPEREGARPCCQSQRGRANFVLSFLGFGRRDSVVEKFGELILNWRFVVEDGGAFGVEGDFSDLAGIGRLRCFSGLLPLLVLEVKVR